MIYEKNLVLSVTKNTQVRRYEKCNRRMLFPSVGFFSCTLLLEKFDFLIASFVRYNACSRNSDYTDSPAPERQGGEQQKK